ncbi:MAG: HmuY family protein [Chitinophagaceae bacterium]|jgi:hypothetical protein|nr:HmuY family protein [Chitinophagaceae bacterium]OQY96359.1 MAG: hypothetical protein B6D37_02375 [Sphingobacteriales bacterium UTBCD1]
MKTKFIPLLMIFTAASGLLFFSSCKKDNSSAVKTTNVDTAVLAVNFSSNSPFAFFSFKNKTVVNNSDSATGKWDFGLRLTTFLVNSNASGPGNAGVILQNGIFDNITSAPASGYAYDTAAGHLAITDGTWYSYNMNTHSFLPNPGKVFIFRTADNHYAKMEILEAVYEPFTGPVPKIINYKLRFVYQPNGTLNF